MLLKSPYRLGIVGTLMVSTSLSVSCSTKKTSSNASSGAAGISGASGASQGGTGGIANPTGGNAGMAGASGAGAAGSSGSSGSAPTFIPEWKTVGSHETCAVQALVNKSEAIAFKWEPCHGATNCERARTSTGNFLGETKLFNPSTRVAQIDGDTIINLITTNNGKTTGLALTETGAVKQAFRTKFSGSGVTCGVPRIDSHRVRLEFDIAHKIGNKTHFDRYTGPLEGEAFSLSNPDFTKVTMPSGQKVGVPGLSETITSTHQLFSSHNYTVISSMEFGKPETLKLLYHPEITPLGASVVQRHGDRVAYTVRTSVGLGGERTTYYLSDGSTQGSVYLDSTNEYDIGSLRFAHSHVAWLQGKYPKDGSQTRSDVELWSSKIVSNSDKITPELVAKLPNFNSVYSVIFFAEGGFGRYVIPVASDEGDPRLQVWDLATKTKKEYVAPSGTIIRSIKGLTEKYLWVTIFDQHGADPASIVENEYLVRYRVDDKK